MILIIHHKRDKVTRVLRDNCEIEIVSGQCAETFWELGQKYPEEIIAWCEEKYSDNLNFKQWSKIFHHDLIIASYGVNSTYIPDSIGYIDQLPFVNVNRNVQYATWRMSTDVGGIKGKVLLKFQNLFGHIKEFSMLLNSIAKLGQQNGLFCYSAPSLINEMIQVNSSKKLDATASNKKLFSFVYSHYKFQRLWLLLWCFIKYERSIPLLDFCGALFKRKYFKKVIDLSSISVKSVKTGTISNTIDVIIPTLSRRDYLLQVLEDLKEQTFLPKKVIVVEQNPDPGSHTELPEITNHFWPFEIVHHFTHQTGACNARNMALNEVNADWVFFADDDNKMDKDVLKKAINEIKILGIDLLTLQYSQEGEQLIFDKVKQWGTFGAGNSIISGRFASEIRFDMAFEHGYGEDKDYGMQLRNAGCDIIYHPDIEIKHLKAPRGGFREITLPPWTKDRPKPSPSLMVYAKKHYSPQQLKGFKTELFFRFYFNQEIRNPFKYLGIMKKRWTTSEEWAEQLRGNSIKSINSSER